MKKIDFVIDEESDVGLFAYYRAMRKLVEEKYPAEFARARSEQQGRNGSNFSVFGKRVALLEMVDGLILFVNQQPLDCQHELKVYLHEKENIKEVKYILGTLEGFLRKLPGTKLPEPRPAAMDDLMRIA